MGVDNRVRMARNAEDLQSNPRPVLLLASGEVRELLPDFLKDLESRVDTQLDVLKRLVSYDMFELVRLYNRQSMFAHGEWELWCDEEGLCKMDPEVNLIASYFNGDGICGDVFLLPQGLIK